MSHPELLLTAVLGLSAMILWHLHGLRRAARRRRLPLTLLRWAVTGSLLGMLALTHSNPAFLTWLPGR